MTKKTLEQKLSLAHDAVAALPGAAPRVCLGIIDGQFQAVAQDAAQDAAGDFEVRAFGKDHGNDPEAIAEDLLRGTVKKVGQAVGTISGRAGENARAKLRAVEAKL